MRASKTSPGSVSSALERWAALYGVVSFGFSQIFFNMVFARPVAFPLSNPFAIWSLLWLQGLPLLMLAVAERALIKSSADGWRFHIWRGVLYGLTAASLMRQFQVFHAETYTRFFGSIPPPVVFVVSALLAFAAALFLKKWIHTYVAFLGFCALLVPAFFLYTLHPPSKTPASGSGRDDSISEPTVPRINLPEKLPSIYLIIFDELSCDLLLKDGSIDRQLFPNFAALASEGTFMENATTNHWGTVDSIPTILTGWTHPATESPTLLELLSPRYHTNVMLTEIEVENWLRKRIPGTAIDEYRGKVHFLNKNPLSTGLFIGFRMWGFLTFHSPRNVLLDDPEYHVTFPEQKASFFGSVSKHQPELIFWHVSFPHSPFLYSEDGTKHGGNATFFPFAEEYQPSQFDSILGRYRDQVRYADRILGEVVHGLKSSGAYDQSILVVLSDHGLRVWGLPFRYVGLTAHVPVLFHAPGIQASVNHSDFQLIDLVPSLLSLLQIQYDPAMFEGRATLQKPVEHRTKTLYFHPANISYSYDQTEKQWVPTSRISKDVIAESSVAPAARFSTTQVLDDLMMARERQQDFLTLYLSRHFPRSVGDSDVDALHASLELLETAPPTVRNNFKRGMYYFFLALSETYLISEGRELDAVQVNGDWQEALVYLRKTGDLQPWMVEAVQKLLTDSDLDDDGTLSTAELAGIIRSRPTGLALP